jgi:hypothetical protein
MNIILSDYSHHSVLRLFFLMTGSAVLFGVSQVHASYFTVLQLSQVTEFYIATSKTFFWHVEF